MDGWDLQHDHVSPIFRMPTPTSASKKALGSAESGKTRCKYCQHTFHRVNVKEHESECPKRMLPCPQQCRAQVAADSLDLHLKEQCPFAIMSCPFASMGCDVVGLQRLEMETHLRNSMPKHLEILCLKVDSNSKIITRQQEQIEKLLSRSPLEVSPAMNGMFKTVAGALAVAEDGDRIVVHEGMVL